MTLRPAIVALALALTSGGCRSAPSSPASGVGPPELAAHAGPAACVTAGPLRSAWLAPFPGGRVAARTVGVDETTPVLALDPATGRGAQIGAAHYTDTPEAHAGLGALLVERGTAPPGVSLVSTLINRDDREVGRLVLARPDGRREVVSAPGHDVTSHAVLGDTIYYTAGKQLWERPLGGGTPTPSRAGDQMYEIRVVDAARDHLYVWAGPGDTNGIWRRHRDGRLDHLTEVPFHDVAVDVDGWVYLRALDAPLVRAVSPEGEDLTVADDARGAFLVQGDGRVLLARPTPDGSRVEALRAGVAAPLWEVRGGVVTAVAPLADGRVVALVGHDTDRDGAVRTNDEADLCVVAAGFTGGFTVPSRDLPWAIHSRREALTQALTALGHTVVRLTGKDGGRTLVVDISDRGPTELEALMAAAREARLAVARVGLEDVSVMLGFAGGAFGLDALERRARSGRDGARYVRYAGLDEGGPIVVGEPDDFEVHLVALTVSPIDGTERFLCQGSIVNRTGGPLATTVECERHGPEDVGHGWFFGAPAEMRSSTSPAVVPPGALATFSVVAPHLPDHLPVAGEDADGRVIFFNVARNARARALYEALREAGLTSVGGERRTPMFTRSQVAPLAYGAGYFPDELVVTGVAGGLAPDCGAVERVRAAFPEVAIRAARAACP